MCICAYVCVTCIGEKKRMREGGEKDERWVKDTSQHPEYHLQNLSFCHVILDAIMINMHHLKFCCLFYFCGFLSDTQRKIYPLCIHAGCQS